MAALFLILIFFSFFLLLLVGGVVAIVRASNRSYSVGSPAILSIIPRPAKIIASIFFTLGVTIGPLAGALSFGSGQHHSPHAWILGMAVGLGAGLFAGSIFAALTLCYGYVYGDARRRGMPAVPWTFVVILVPNLLGFLLYFVLRKPLASPCSQCGQAITPEQRFCSWCGHQQYTAPYTTTVAPTSPTGL